MSDEINLIERYYDDNTGNEWNRLERHRTEFAVTMRALSNWLPSAPATILDIGGGPGRYSIELAKRGYDVTLLDLSQRNLDFARSKADEVGVALQDYVHGNALDLSRHPKRSFDAVLLMGPLYHLFTLEDRKRAVGEAWRVLRPGSVIFVACITRFAAIREAAATDPEWYVRERGVVERYLETGVLRVAPEEGFIDHYSFHPTELAPFLEEVGFKTHTLVGIEGVVARHESNINELCGEAWARWVDLNYRLGQDSTLHGASDHLLYVGRKQGRFASAIVRRGDEILLQQAQGPDDAAPCWYLPGGSVEAHETYEQAAVREVREETGIEVLKIGALAYTVHMHNPANNLGGVAHIFEVSAWRGDIAVDDPDGVTLQARFAPLDEAIQLIETTLPYRNMCDPLLAYLRGERTSEWRYSRDDDGAMGRINP